MRDEIAGLLAEDFDLSLLGITDEDLDALLRDPEQVDGGAVEGEDDIPEPPVTPVSVAGDLWQLGSHRLICGDSTSADVVGRLLGDVKPLLMVTDPPHGVEYDPSWRNQGQDSFLFHSQNMTAAARAMAERKTFGHRS